MAPEKIKVACFGLQGFGNDLLLALHKNEKAEITAIYTREPGYQFDYYECDTIESLAKRLNVPVQYIPDTNNWECESSELAIISSFHRIFKKQHIDRFNRVVNIHPSLLPRYRGATPTNWTIRNGDVITGITAHLVDESVDAGPIIYQRQVLNPYLNDNQLRKVLSFISSEAVELVISQYPDFRTQNTDFPESYEPARSDSDSLAKLKDFNSVEELIFHIKAFTNYPMPKLEIDGSVFVIDYDNPSETVSIELDGKIFYLVGHWI